MEQKKDELNIAICGNATNITAYVEHFFQDKYGFKFCAESAAHFLMQITTKTKPGTYGASIKP
jgi:hypothetical protein